MEQYPAATIRLTAKGKGAASVGRHNGGGRPWDRGARNPGVGAGVCRFVSTPGRKRPRASTPKGSRKTVVRCSYTTPHILDYQRVSPFWGGKARNTARLG